MREIPVNHPEVFLSLIATFALHHGSDAFGSFRLAQHPFADGPRRIVAHMLGVAAGERGDPMLLFVLMKAGHGLLHRASFHDIQ